MTSYPDREWLQQKYCKEGLSAIEIADIVGCDPSSVYYHMDKKNIDRRSRGRKGSCGVEFLDGYEIFRHNFDGEQKDVIIHHLVSIADGEDPHDVFSDDYHVHHKDGIRWHNSPENITLIGKDEHASIHMDEKRHKKTCESRRGEWWDKEKLRKMYHDDGMTTENIAKKFECSQKVISETMNKLGIETRSKGDTSPKPWHDEENLRELRVKQRLTIKEISNELDCSKPTVRKWLKNYNIVKP